jgi:hypothetical protein
MKRKIKDPIRAAKIAIEYLDGIELDDAQARHYLERVQRRLQMIVTGYRMKGRENESRVDSGKFQR